MCVNVYYMCMYVCVWMCMYVYVYVCVWMCVYVVLCVMCACVLEEYISYEHKWAMCGGEGGGGDII